MAEENIENPQSNIAPVAKQGASSVPTGASAATGGAEGAVADVAKKQVKKKILLALAPYLPVIIAVVGVVFVVFVIALTIISYVNKGSGGKTNFVKPSPVNVALTMAKTDNASAKSEAVSLAGEQLLSSLDELKAKLEANNDQTNLQKLKDLETALLSLITNDPTNTVAISEIQRRIDELKTSIGATYKNEFQNITDALDALNRALLTSSSPKLIISGKDQYYIRTNQVDDRILQALNYLVTPVAEGGAGFRKIKVRRIKADYDRENKQFSKEWEFASEEDRTISPHFSGQAVDIAGIDSISRSLYKSGYVRKKREMQAPVDIMVAYQSNIPGKAMPGSSVTSTGFSLGNMSGNQALTDLFNIIGENSGYDFSKYNLEGATLPEIAKTMGAVALNEELSLRINSMDDNSSQEKILLNLGKDYVANYFSLPKEGLKGDDPDTIQTNIGREVIAQRMKLAPLSLTGSTSQELFNSTGKRKVEKNFGLRAGSLDYLTGDFTSFAGQVLIEGKLNLEGGSFAGNDLTQIKNKINIKGDNRFASTFTTNPDQVDVILNLPQDKEYTKGLLNNSISVFEYKKAVGASLIKSVSTNFQAKTALDVYVKNGTDGCNGTVVAGTCLGSSGATYTKKDDAWDMPYGSIDSIISGDYTSFYRIGADEITKRLVDDAGEREVLKLWFTSYKNKNLEDFRFIYSEMLGETRIGFKSDALVKDEAAIKSAKDAADHLVPGSSSLSVDGITAKQRAIRAVPSPGCVAYDWDCANGRAATDAMNRQLNVLEELKWQLMLGDPEEWFDIDQIAINSALGLPENGITKIFQLDQGDEMFFMVGGAKIEAGDTSHDPDAARISAGKINFVNSQITQTKNEIAKLEARKAGGEQGLDNQINVLKRALSTWSAQLVLEQTNQAELAANLNSTRPQRRDADIKFNFGKFSDISSDLNSVFTFLGSQKMESSLNLPAGSLASIFDYTQTESIELKYLNTQRETTAKALQALQDRKNKGEKGLDSQISAQERSLKSWDSLIEQQQQNDHNKKSGQIKADPVLIGKKQIEEVLRLTKGSFGGSNTEELTTMLGGNQKLYSYFAPNTNFTDISKQLPITTANAYYFKSILKANDTKLSLMNDTTYDLLKGNITPDQYAKKVGIATIRTRTIDTLGSNLGLDVGGYALTGNDVTAILNGDYLPILLKVGAKNLDDNIELPIGTLKAMIDNPSLTCQVKDPTTGLQQSCLENLLVANGQEKLARYMGVFGQTMTTNNLSEKLGQIAIEKALKELYPSPALANGWFEGDGLIDISKNLALATGSPDEISKINKASQSQTDAILANSVINKYGNIVLEKFGFKANNWTVFNIDQIDFIQNSDPYNLAKRVDDKLGVAVGTTARFFTKNFTTSDYKNSVQSSYLTKKASDWIFDALPPDIQEYLKEPAIKGFLDRINLFNIGGRSGPSNPAEVKGYENIAKDPKKKKGFKTIIDNYLQYAETYPKDNVMGQVIIEDRLGWEPIGWFDEISAKDAPKTKGLDGVVKNIAFLNNFGGAIGTIQTRYLAINDPSKLREAENIFLSKFGFDPNYYSLNSLKTAAFDPKDTTPSNPYIITRRTDKLLNIKEGTTQELFQGTLSVDDYKEKVRKAYINDEIGDIAYSLLFSEDMQAKLAKYGITGEDVRAGFNDPNALFNKALMNVINPDDLYTILGFQDILGIKLPIKGEFPDNFAQKVVEERLGLVEGSFSPNSTIDKVIDVNTPKKFAASFRISIDKSKPDAEIKSFILSTVGNSGSNYWSNTENPLNISRIGSVDVVLKINNDTIVSNPTQKLLQKKISISEYLALIKKNQFSQFDRESFTTNFASFLSTSNTEDGQRSFAYMNLVGTAFAAYGNPKLLTDQNIQLSLLRNLKSAGVIDLDEKIGFSSGTMENIILHPGDAKSILFSQGLRSVAEKNFFGDAEPYKKDLLILFQYYLPDSISNPAYFTSIGQGAGGAGLDPNNAGNCVQPDQAMDYRVAMLPGDEQNFRNKHRSLCAYQILDVALRDIIKQSTTIKDKDGNMLPGGEGVDIPIQDVRLLEKGDMGVLTNVGLAYAVNRVKAEQDGSGNNLQLIPPDFHITYNEIKAALNPSSQQKREIEKRDVAQWEKTHKITSDAGLPSMTQEDYQKWREDVRKKAMVNAKKEIEYRYFDAQLMSLAKANDMAPIPAGFTKTMLTGSDTERTTMLLAYGINNLLLGPNFEKVIGEENLPYAGGLKNALSSFVSTKDLVKLKEYFTNGQVARDPIFLAVDNFLAADFKKTGLNIVPPKGLAEYVLVKGYSELGGNVGQVELDKMNAFGKNVVKDFTVNLVSQFLDKKLGLKPGTAQGVYGVYKAYKAVTVARDAQLAYNAAQLEHGAAAINAALDPAKAGELATATQNLTKAEADLAKAGSAEVAQANMINLAVSLALFVFSDEIAVADQKANMPPGSTASIVSFAASWASYSTVSAGAAGSSAMAAGVWIAAAFMVYTVVFGFNKVEFQITCPGDYSFTSWCAESEGLYTQWAQMNTRKLIDDMLKINERTGKKNLLPTILGTFRKEDYNYFNGIAPDGTNDLISKYYGSISMLRGVRGLHQSDYMAEFVHIGY
jgi:hypothetical protein